MILTLLQNIMIGLEFPWIFHSLRSIAQISSNPLFQIDCTNRLYKFTVGYLNSINLEKLQVKVLAWPENATDKSDHLNALTVLNAVIYPSPVP